MAAPSCLCVCGARGGLAQVWHTSGTRVVLPLHVPCRVGWRRSRAHAVPRGLAQVACTCRAAWARASKISASCCASWSLRAPHRRGCQGASVSRAFDPYGGTYRLFSNIYTQHGLEFDYVDLTDADASARAGARFDSGADTRQAGNRRAPAAPFGRPRKRGGPYRRLGAGDRVTLSREEKTPRLRVLPGTGAPGCGLACDSEWSSR